MKQEWIVVASHEEVRIFARSGVRPLELIREIGNPAGILRTQDLESDSPGRSTDNRMRARHAYSSQESSRDRSLKTFYREIIEFLQQGAFEHRFDSLTIIAEPRLLGILRPLLSKQLHTLVHHEISKDLSYEEPAEILARLDSV